MSNLESKFFDPESRFQGGFGHAVFDAIVLAYRPYFNIIVAVVALGFLARGTLLFIPNVMGFWADSLCQGSKVCHAPPSFLEGFNNLHFVSLVAGMTLVGFLSNSLFRIGIARTGTRAASGLYDLVTARASQFPMGFFDKTPLGRILTRFSVDYAAVFRMAGGPMGELICIVYDLMFAVIFVAVASPFYLPVVGLAILATTLLFRFNRARLRQDRRLVSAVRGPAIAHFSESAQGAVSVRAAARGASFLGEMQGRQNEYLKQRARTFFSVQTFGLKSHTLTCVLLLATGALGVVLVLKGYASAPTIAVAFTFVTLTSTTLQQLFEYLASLDEALTGVERLSEYLIRPTESSVVTNFEGSDAALRVDDLVFHYPGGPSVLHDVSFCISQGQTLGVVGRTGSGKSSLVQALLFLYPWEQGKIWLPIPDGTNKDLLNYRSQWGFLPQEPILFRGSLLENVFGFQKNVHKFTDEEICILFSELNLERFLFPGGRKASKTNLWHNLKSFVVEERGQNLSLGERQLLCLARLILQKRPLAVLDEATSHIDPETEKVLQSVSERYLKRQTKVLVAHRLNTVESCDQILWLEKGRVRDFGSPMHVLPRYLASKEHESLQAHK
jgi:ABC-type multidrug transport system fused ATPase/permease subunit